jgi:hypothetical protein
MAQAELAVLVAHLAVAVTAAEWTVAPQMPTPTYLHLKKCHQGNNQSMH